MEVPRGVCYGVCVDLLLLVLRVFQGHKSDQPDKGSMNMNAKWKLLTSTLY